MFVIPPPGGGLVVIVIVVVFVGCGFGEGTGGSVDDFFGGSEYGDTVPFCDLFVGTVDSTINDDDAIVESPAYGYAVLG